MTVSGFSEMLNPDTVIETWMFLASGAGG